MTLTRFGQMFKRVGVPASQRQFAVDVVYYPRDGSASRTIKGRVERGTMEIINETGDVLSQAIIVTVENDNGKGIASDEIDTGGDKLAVARRVGKDAEQRSIVRVLSDNAGMVRFLCQ